MGLQVATSVIRRLKSHCGRTLILRRVAVNSRILNAPGTEVDKQVCQPEAVQQTPERDGNLHNVRTESAFCQEIRVHKKLWKPPRTKIHICTVCELVAGNCASATEQHVKLFKLSSNFVPGCYHVTKTWVRATETCTTSLDTRVFILNVVSSSNHRKLRNFSRRKRIYHSPKKFCVPQKESPHQIKPLQKLHLAIFKFQTLEKKIYTIQGYRSFYIPAHSLFRKESSSCCGWDNLTKSS